MSLPPIPVFIFQPHIPKPERVAAIRRYVANARQSGVFLSENASGIPFDGVIEKLAAHAGAFRYLIEHTKSGAKESKSGVHAHLLSLKRALTDFAAASAALRPLLGSELYDAVGSREMGLLESVYSEATGEPSEWVAGTGYILSDPLGWASHDQPASMKRSEEWAVQALARVTRAIEMIANPGTDRGSPSMAYARDALDTWLLLACRPGEPVKLPTRKRLADWLDLAFDFADNQSGQDHSNLARRLLDRQSELMISGIARATYPG